MFRAFLFWCQAVINALPPGDEFNIEDFVKVLEALGVRVDRAAIDIIDQRVYSQKFWGAVRNKEARGREEAREHRFAPKAKARPKPKAKAGPVRGRPQKSAKQKGQVRSLRRSRHYWMAKVSSVHSGYRSAHPLIDRPDKSFCV
jgi:hypothetical protein